MKRIALLFVAALALASCRNPEVYRHGADRAALDIIADKQQEALGHTEPFTIETPARTLRRRLLEGQSLAVAGPLSYGVDGLESIEHWPEKSYPSPGGEAEGPPPGKAGKTLRLTLIEALQVGARNSRDYQARKEEIYRTALDLDLEREEFRSTFAGMLEGLVDTDGSSGESVGGARASAEGSFGRRLRSGAELTGRIALDLVKLLTGDRSSSLGILADTSISIPLLRGSGRHIVTEPLQQAERNVIYAIWGFERFKRTFAVEVARDYFAALQSGREVLNSEQNYRGLIVSTRRARRLADAGRLPLFQFDQALQNELRARNRWILARESFQRSLDGLKGTLALPPDADMSLDEGELARLAEAADRHLETGGGLKEDETVPPADAPVILPLPEAAGGEGRLAMKEGPALDLALANRLDLRSARGRVVDAQRAVVVAADALRGELTLLGSASAGERRTGGSADLNDAVLDASEGRYSALLSLDLALERTAEAAAYRESFIGLEGAVRDFQQLEDRIKVQVRERLRELVQSREGIAIQARAVAIAERRVKSTDLLLQAGRAEIRDLLESQEALLNARNDYTSSLVGYRVAELELQRDLGILEVDARGLWTEYDPGG